MLLVLLLIATILATDWLVSALSKHICAKELAVPLPYAVALAIITKLYQVSVDKVIVDGLIARDVSKRNAFKSSAETYVNTLVSAKANADAKKSLLEELKDTDREVYNDQVRVYRTKSGRRIALQNKLDVA